MADQLWLIHYDCFASVPVTTSTSPLEKEFDKMMTAEKSKRLHVLAIIPVPLRPSAIWCHLGKVWKKDNSTFQAQCAKNRLTKVTLVHIHA